MTYPYIQKPMVKNYDLNTTIKVMEVFNSIDGEQPRMGETTTFVRLAGCNLACCYCDTEDSQNADNGTIMTVKELVKHVNSVAINRNVTITGGEPFVQMDELCELCHRLSVLEYIINIETNGTINPDDSLLHTTNCLVYDYKSPDLFKIDIEKLRANDVIKCVINSIAAFEVVKKVAETYKYTNIYVGCVNGAEACLEEEQLVNLILDSKKPNLFFNTQLHKRINVK